MLYFNKYIFIFCYSLRLFTCYWNHFKREYSGVLYSCVKNNVTCLSKIMDDKYRNQLLKNVLYMYTNTMYNFMGLLLVSAWFLGECCNFMIHLHFSWLKTRNRNLLICQWISWLHLTSDLPKNIVFLWFYKSCLNEKNSHCMCRFISSSSMGKMIALLCSGIYTVHNVQSG